MTETPDIIYTQQFVAANVQYLDYSEREEAVENGRKPLISIRGQAR